MGYLCKEKQYEVRARLTSSLKMEKNRRKNYHIFITLVQNKTEMKKNKKAKKRL